MTCCWRVLSCAAPQTFCDIDMLVYASVWLPWPFAEVRGLLLSWTTCLTTRNAGHHARENKLRTCLGHCSWESVLCRHSLGAVLSLMSQGEMVCGAGCVSCNHVSPANAAGCADLCSGR